jgi:hypothetical protein
VPAPNLVVTFCTFYYLAISIESLYPGEGGGGNVKGGIPYPQLNGTECPPGEGERGNVKGGIPYPQLNGPECPPWGGGGGEESGTQSSCTR